MVYKSLYRRCSDISGVRDTLSGARGMPHNVPRAAKLLRLWTLPSPHVEKA